MGEETKNFGVAKEDYKCFISIKYDKEDKEKAE